METKKSSPFFFLLYNTSEGKAMKISLIADPHLNKTIYKGVMDEQYPDIPFRNADLMRAFEFAIDKNINEIHPDLIVVLGDVYDTPHPLNPIRTFFNSQLRRLSEANIPVIILVGNHDICSKHHALEPIAALGLKHVKVIEEPKLTLFKDKALMLFPYSLAVEKKEITIKDQFYKFVTSSRKLMILNPNFKDKGILFFGHFPVNGAIKNSYDDDDINDIAGANPEVVEKKMVYNHNDSDISLADLDTIGASHIFLGDFHKHQELNTKTPAYYIGSPEKCNFSEMDFWK
jgi:DNA repair protein SbcD/Mre11